MNEALRQAEPAVRNLLEADEDTLYEQLGIRATAFADAPQLAGEFAPVVSYDAVVMGPLDTVRELGKRIFDRWNREAYGLVCGGGGDSKDRDALLDSIGVGQTAFAALLASIIVTTFGLAPAIAAVIAAIVVKRFFRPAYEEFCGVWKEKLPAAS
jgi:hypothetical protein